MALAKPTNISKTVDNSTGIRLVFRATNSDAAAVVMRFTPQVYSEFYVDVSQNISAGTNVQHTFNLEWDTALVNLMRGITYGISMFLRTSTEQSPIATTSITTKKPFPTTTIGSHSNPGFTVSTIQIPENRVSEAIVSTDELKYEGTWAAYPKIILNGPFNYCKVANTATGISIGIDAIVPSGDVRVIETNPRSSQWGLYGGTSLTTLEDKVSELTEESNLRKFYFPASNELIRPLALEVYFYNRTNATSMKVEYVTRLYGL